MLYRGTKVKPYLIHSESEEEFLTFLNAIPENIVEVIYNVGITADFMNPNPFAQMHRLHGALILVEIVENKG